MMSETMRSRKQVSVSVIIPAYNVSAYISEALDSVFAQDFKNYEIIVVNDGSQDTPELERALEPYMQYLIYLKQPNGGISSARNAALRVANGRYAAFLDSDDVWLPNKLSEQVTFLEAGGYDMVYADALLIGDISWSMGTTFMDRSPSQGEANLESLLDIRCCVPLLTVVVKRELLFEAGLFDETERHLTEDFDMWLRLAQRGARIGYQKKVLAKYRYRPDNISADAFYLHEASLRSLRKAKRLLKLTTAELNALERTEEKLVRARSLERSKLMILEGEFDRATEVLTQLRHRSKGWKVSSALIGLKIWPALVQKFVQSTSRKATNKRVIDDSKSSNLSHTA